MALLSWSPFPLLFHGDGTVRSQLCRAVCPRAVCSLQDSGQSSQGGWKPFVHRDPPRLDLWNGPCVSRALIRSRTEHVLGARRTKEFLPQPLKAFPVGCGLPSLQPWTLFAAASLFALIPGGGSGNDTLRRWAAPCASSDMDPLTTAQGITASTRL